MNARGLSVIIYRAIVGTDTTLKTSNRKEWSPLDGRFPDVTLTEIRETGKSAEQLRVGKGTGSVVDWLVAKIDDRLSRPGRERG